MFQTWLRPRVAVAVVYVGVTPIGPLAWELPHAVGVALKSKRKKKRKMKNQKCV